MQIPIIPANEDERLKSLKSLDILDTVHEERFDRITRLAKRMFNVPIAIVSLIDKNRQWFKSCVGLEVDHTDRSISFCGHAILDSAILIVPDASQDPRFSDNPLVVNEPFIRFYAGRPIKTPDGQRIGTLCIIDTQPRLFNVDDCLSLNDLAEMVEHEIEITHMATIDDLTHTSNRRGFMAIADYELKRCARNGLSASLVFFDLDKFKQINDEFGHAEGDKALRFFAHILKNTLRESDIIARIGGDEFVVLLSDTTEKITYDVIARCQQLLEQHNQNTDQQYMIEFSFGVAEYDPYRHISIDVLLMEADDNMYKNKQVKA